MVSDEQLIQDLKAFADELGETPTIRQMRTNGPWSGSVYRKHFGSWNQALKEAGLEPVKKHPNSKEELLGDLQQFADELGETPIVRQMRENGPWSVRVYQKHFESWSQALKEAGFEPTKEHSASKQQLVEDLREFADEMGETPTERQMNEDGPWSAEPYREQFGSWNEALKETGLDPITEYTDSKQQLVEDLREFADEISKTPTVAQMNEDGPWSTNTYSTHFGSWNEALKEAGLQANNLHSNSKQELIEDLQQFAEQIGRAPTKKQMNEDGPWDSTTYQNHFESWNKALRKSGFSVHQRHNMSELDLIQDLKGFADDIGETPSYTQMNEKGPAHTSVYENHFGSWTEALKEAGFEPVREYPVEPEWADGVNDYYGESWSEMRAKAVQRDDEQCRVCGDDELIHVHHIKPRRCFEDPDNSNTLDNLITLCPSCHGRFENRWTDTDPDEFESKARELLRVE